MSKQTAVEWLIGMISYTSKDTHSAMESSNFFDKAKAMEREQIVSFCYDFIPTIQVVDNETVYTKLPEEIYNKTYGKEASHEG